MKTITNQIKKYHKEICEYHSVISKELESIQTSLTLLLIYYKKSRGEK